MLHCHTTMTLVAGILACSCVALAMRSDTAFLNLLCQNARDAGALLTTRGLDQISILTMTSGLQASFIRIHFVLQDIRAAARWAMQTDEFPVGILAPPALKHDVQHLPPETTIASTAVRALLPKLLSQSACYHAVSTPLHCPCTLCTMHVNITAGCRLCPQTTKAGAGINNIKQCFLRLLQA